MCVHLVISRTKTHLQPVLHVLSANFLLCWAPLVARYRFVRCLSLIACCRCVLWARASERRGSLRALCANLVCLRSCLSFSLNLLSLGFFANNTGFSSCFACPPGSFSSNSGAGSTSCTRMFSFFAFDVILLYLSAACGIGRYSNLPGFVACVDCGAGEYGATKGLTVCKLCAPGNYSTNSQAAACVPCPVVCLSGLFACC